MLRLVLGIIAGVVVGGVVVALVERAGHMVFPPPEGTNLKDPEALKAIMAQIPLGAKIAVLVAWFCGVFAGGTAARFITKGAPSSAWIVGGIFALFTAINLFMIPHPVWMIAGAIIAIAAGILAANQFARTRV